MRSPRVAARACLVTLFSIAVTHPAAFAAWPHDPANGSLAICTTATGQYFPSVLPDGSGGVFVLWYGTNANDIFLQRVSANGVPLWTANGVYVCQYPGGQTNPTMTSDGAGGVIVAWMDARNGGQNDLYAQRMNGSGVAQWTSNGIPVCLATGDQGSPQIVGDGAGGAIISWQDARSGGYDVYAQRVNASGVPQWTADGVQLTGAANDQNAPVIAADGAGGAIVCWQDQRAGVGVYDIYGQRVNASGVAQWAAGGIGFCIATANQLAPQMVSDGAGGAIATWYDQRSGNSDIYAQHVSPTGSMLWNGNGTAISAATNDQNLPALVADGSGGAIIAWADYRNGGVPDVYAQRVNGSGTTLWTANGVALCTAVNLQTSVVVGTDGAQGAIVVWQDLRGFGTDLYAQRVSASGVPLWTTDGVAVCTAVGSQSAQAVASDGAGGVIVAWADARNVADVDIYGQRVERFGQLGSPEPAIVNVRDVPGDQGGKVSLQWNASYLDADPWNLVANYWIWRQAPRTAALAALARGARLVGADGDARPGGAGLWRTTGTAAQTYYWEYLGSQPAQGFAGYSFVAATTSDSTGAANPRTYFMVEARSSGTAYWSSAPDSGYSVDDLAPATPAPFSGQYSSGTATLHWGVSTEADFADYRLYRGTSSGFVPGPANLVATQPDTGYVDVAGGPYYYKLAAVDVHGNASGYALLLPSGTAGVEPGSSSARLGLAMLGTNPARNGATLAFSLPGDGAVRITVHDQQGRAVRVLESGVFAAGTHRATWDGRDASGARVGSGIYFVRLETGFGTRGLKLAIVH